MIAMPGPFKAEIDSFADHCSWRLPDILVGLPLWLSSQFASLDVEDAYAVCERLLEDSPALLEAGWFSAVNGIADQLAPCAQHRCDCAYDSVECEIDAVNEMLATLGDHCWATFDDSGEAETPLHGVLTVSGVFHDALSWWRDGWSSVKLSFDDPTLELVFQDDRGSCSTVRLVRLSPVAVEAYESLTSYSNETAGSLLVYSEPVLAVIQVLYDAKFELTPAEWPNPIDEFSAGEPSSFEDMLKVAKTSGLFELSPNALLAAAALASNWSAAFTDLPPAAHAACAISAVV